MSEDWVPDLSTIKEIEDLVAVMLAQFPYLLGIDEIIPDCEVINNDPDGVGVGVIPRWITVSLRDQYHCHAFWRGVPGGIAAADVVTVLHMRDGDRYEVLGGGGPTGTSGGLGVHTHLTDPQGGQLAGEIFDGTVYPDTDAVPVYADFTWGAGSDVGQFRAAPTRRWLILIGWFLAARDWRLYVADAEDAYIDFPADTYTNWLKWRVWDVAGTVWDTLWQMSQAGQMLLVDGFLDLDGIADALVMDADGDTTLDGAVDDEIQLKTGGVDQGVLTTRVDSITRTVKAMGGDHVTIQSAIDWFKGKIITGACKIVADAGNYDEGIVFEDLFIGKGGSLILEGDTRVLVGMSWVDGATCNPAGLANGGTGVVTLTNAGNNITVAMAGGNPDFAADGFTGGDDILVYNNAGGVAMYNLNAVVGNVLTLSVAAPAVGNDGTAIALRPNRRVERTAAGTCITVDMVKGVQLDGWYLDTATGASCNGLWATKGAYVLCENILIRAEDLAFDCTRTSVLLMITDHWGSCSAWDSYGGVYSDGFSNLFARGCMAVDCQFGFWATYKSFLYARDCVAVHSSSQGYRGQHNAMINAYNATARQCGTGYYANFTTFLYADVTNAKNNGNGVNYNPAPGIPGSVQGNHFAVMYAS